MGKYDKYDTEYFTDRKRFAELISVGLFRRKMLVDADTLVPLEKDYPSLGSTSAKLERDGLYRDTDTHVRYGLEIETHDNLIMPRRFMTYDTCDYERQARQLRAEHERKGDLFNYLERRCGMKEGDYYEPVINLLLYLGVGHFSYKYTMRDLFGKDSDRHPLITEKVQNYSFMTLEADYVNPEDFKTDLRFFFKAMQCRKSKQKLKSFIEEIETQDVPAQTQQMIVLHLGNKKLLKKVIEEDVPMCKAMRDLEKDWRNEGFTEGRTAGIAEGKATGIAEGKATGIAEGKATGETTSLIKQICKKLVKGKTIPEIADDLEEDCSRIQTIVDVAKSFAPNFDVNAIYQKLCSGTNKCNSSL